MHAFLTLREGGFDIDITSENEVEDAIFRAFSCGDGYPASVKLIKGGKRTLPHSASGMFSYEGAVVRGLHVGVRYEPLPDSQEEQVADVVDGGRSAESPER